MVVKIVLLSLTIYSIYSFVSCKDCYWNARCPYQLFSSKTPYESVRGDLRDENMPNCQPISLWSLHRHGNRNPSLQVTEEIKELQKKIIYEILIAYENNRTHLTNCFQDIEDLLHWSWNSTLDTLPNYLTGIGYEEIFDLGKRVREKFETLLSGTPDKFYFRPTNEQRTTTSAIAFVHGLTFGTGANLTTSIDEPWEQDNVIRPYESCKKYQNEVKKGQKLVNQLALYDSSPEVLAVTERVRKHLGIKYQVTVADTYNLYELCRFHRSWSPNLRSPWCSFFTNEDLEVMEYRDDVRHYYRNGYGSEVNANLGTSALKDLYENFENATLNRGKNIVSYFTHDTMFEMVISALGLYKDTEPLHGSYRNANRLWRTSEIAAFSTNLIAVLFKCQEQGDDMYRVQFLINEKPAHLCPEEGCTWKQFVDRFKIFTNANFEFCLNKEYLYNPITNGGFNISIVSLLLLLPTLLII
ncbi:multiple inositol polyphosphate phosphatase 1-like [Nymphalis io]|uniref:multiple inositol polyphosphate phosphatase 1-like n=1 Tax=Inachis io TaxID=171585 RepID=UPI0021695B4B|nr:multiple inositol polyphosphate phosphatase 1-like [Nymphalis io]